jgi:hypothetical protein
MSKKKRKKQKRMGPGTIIFLGIFLIGLFLYWLLVSYTFIEYFSGNYIFEDKEFSGFTIPAKYVPFIGAALWFGGLFGVVEIFNEIKKWLKNK